MSETLIERARLLTFRKGEVVKWAITTNVPIRVVAIIENKVIASLNISASILRLSALRRDAFMEKNVSLTQINRAS